MSKKTFPNKETQFSKDNQPKDNGRPKKLVSKVLDELKEEGEQVSKSQVFDIYQIMISLTMKKLREISTDDTKPALYRILAKEILGKKGFEAIEKMLDRANGKPMQMQEIKVKESQELTDEELNARIAEYEKRNSK